jgi:acyl-CoA synthetase (AMP-forming)/AMP-acid ligase II/thioesterase domain-containing protein/acyl carrier protein
MLDLCAAIGLRTPDLGGRPALLAPGREALDYAGFFARTAALAGFLAGHGLSRGDAVAMAMPDGPAAIETFLAVTRAAACAPLNPAFRADEFAFSLADLSARALIVQAGAAPAAVEAARGLGIAVFEVPAAGPAAAGPRQLAAARSPVRQGPPRYDPHTALLLHTSATTGRPKLVPLTHARLSAMIDLMRATFPQGDAGRVLIITPHFHLHCLVSALFQLFSGGAVICTPGFRPGSFLNLMRAFRPTQYTANPTLHRAILSLIPDKGAGDAFASLRFVSSAGAPLADDLRDAIERRLGVPVFEGYGLTEAGRVTLTPADPARRKPGSVGQCCGVEVAVADEEGGLLATGREGEILLRGPTVITGYANDPEADRRAFRDGWFRTGDLGRLDAEGFLYLTGRLKEAVNRGGEKILPYAIEEALGRHPAVLETAVFGVPHPRLGEDLAAAVVVRPGMRLSGPELRRFAAERLADFKVPRAIVFVDAIPKSRTGKPQRARLAELLAVPQARRQEKPAPADALEARLAAIWRALLGVEAIDRDDDFFVLGGDSLLAMQMLLEVENAFACTLGPEALMARATLADVAGALRRAQAAEAPADGGQGPCLKVLQPDGPGRPLVLMCHEGGLYAYRQLVRRLGRNRPVFACEEAGFLAALPAPPTLPALARRYAEELRHVQARGPYWLAGHSLGGHLAVETARVLLASGETVAGVVLIDSACFHWRWRQQLGFHLKTLARRPRGQRRSYLRELFGRAVKRLAGRFRDRPGEPASALHAASLRYRMSPIAVDALLLQCLEAPPVLREAMRQGWSRVIRGELRLCDAPGEHASVLIEPHVGAVAGEIERFMDRPAAQANAARDAAGETR